MIRVAIMESAMYLAARISIVSGIVAIGLAATIPAQLPAQVATPRGCTADGSWCTGDGNSGRSGGYRSNTAPRGPSAEEVAARQANELNEQGLAAYKKGDWAAAEVFFRQSLENMSNAPVVRANLAYTQNHEGVDAYKAGNFAAALNYFQQAIAILPVGDPGTQVIRDDVAAAQSKIDQAQHEKEQRQKDKIAANNMQQSIQNLAQTLNAAPSSGGLDFNDGKGGTTENAGSVSKGLDFVDSSVHLKDSVNDPSLDHKTSRGLFGTKVANPGSTDLTPAGPVGVPGSDTKAGDQLLGAAASSDLTTNYDRGGAKTAGALKMPTKPSIDPATFSPKVRNDPRMMTALKQLEALKAKRAQLGTELERLTVARIVEKDPQKSQELTRQLNQKHDDVQATLLSITKAETTVVKAKRTIETEVEDSKATTGKP